MSFFDVPFELYCTCFLGFCGPGEGSSFVHEYGTPRRKRIFELIFLVELNEKNASEYFVARETRSIFVRRSAKRKDKEEKKLT